MRRLFSHLQEEVALRAQRSAGLLIRGNLSNRHLSVVMSIAIALIGAPVAFAQPRLVLPDNAPQVAEPSPSLEPKVVVPEERERRLPVRPDPDGQPSLAPDPRVVVPREERVTRFPVRPGVIPQPLPSTTRVVLRVPNGEANLQVIVPESVVNQLLEGNRTDCGPVRDRILGADVLGQQTSITAVAVDLHPREGGIHATMRLQGVTNTDTVGQTRQARGAPVGRHQISATKEIYFDGRKFSTEAAVVRTRVVNTPVGASTRYDGVPILSGFARQMALNVANVRRRVSDPIVWQRVSSNAFDKFNTEVDRQLAQANTRLEQDVRTRLETWSVMPAREAVLSTETHVVYSALLRQTEKPLGAIAPAGEASGSAVTLRIHESLLNQAADGLKLEGTSRKPGDLRPIVAQVMALLGGRPVEAAEPSDVDSETTTLRTPELFEPLMVFADRQPLQFHFERDAFAITLTVRFDVAGKTVVPEQRIRITFRGELSDDQFFVNRDEVTVTSVDEASPQMQKVYTDLVRPRVEGSIPNLVFPRSRSLPVPTSRKIRIERLDSGDGWLSAEFALTK